MDPTVDPNLGEVAGAFSLVQRLHRDAIGTTYLARHLESGELTALKLFPQALVAASTETELQEQLAAIRRIRHPNLANVLAVGIHKKTPYLVRQYVAGRVLAEVLGGGAHLPPARAVPLMIQLTQALILPHNSGLLHLNIQPNTVRLALTDDQLGEMAYLLDFGQAQLLDRAWIANNLASLYGAGGYIPPEAWDGVALDARSDLYALGCVFYRMLTGVDAFRGETPIALRQAHHTGTQAAVATMPSLARTRGLSELVMSCLERDRELRPRDACLLLDALLELAARHALHAPEPTADVRAAIADDGVRFEDSEIDLPAVTRVPRSASDATPDSPPRAVTPAAEKDVRRDERSALFEDLLPDSHPQHRQFVESGENVVPSLGVTISRFPEVVQRVSTAESRKKRSRGIGGRAAAAIMCAAILFSAGAYWAITGTGPGPKVEPDGQQRYIVRKERSTHHTAPAGVTPSTRQPRQTVTTTPPRIDTRSTVATPSTPATIHHKHPLSDLRRKPSTILPPVKRTEPVMVLSEPPGAVLYINGKRRGPTPQLVRVTKGKAQLVLWLKQRGYASLTTTLDFEMAQRLKDDRLTLTLTRSTAKTVKHQPPRRPLLKRRQGKTPRKSTSPPKKSTRKPKEPKTEPGVW